MTLWKTLRNVYFTLKYAYQRLTRGWDDRAAWSIDWWLDDKMPDILRKLKKDTHGIPVSVFPTEPQYINEYGDPTDEAEAIAKQRWDDILDKIIAGFEASRRITDGLYEEELGEYPLHQPKNVTKEEWKQAVNKRFLASRTLEERDEKIFKEGMALFVEHYWSLWD